MKLLDFLLGRPLASRRAESERVGPWTALPILGLDGLGSAAYGPEAALTVLIPLGAAGIGYALPVTGLIVAVLGLLYVSYRQTIAEYPGGGGSYIVASRNLGTGWGLLAAASLLLDYVLVVAVGISAGVGALSSAFPALRPHVLAICLAILVALAILNLRGVRESGAIFVLPTYGFVVTLFAAVGLGVWRTVAAGGNPVAVVAPPAPSAALGGMTLFLFARAFASGATAMTGVEAVSDAMAIFAEPRVKNARRTLTAIVAILSILLVGLAIVVRGYGIAAVEPTSPGYQSVLSMVVAAVFGRGTVYFVTIGFVLAVLCLSANTGFADFPRLCQFLARDDFLPHSFAQKGRRLVYARGIVAIALLSGALLIVFGGITDRLIPLFAVGAFGAFTLSQVAMVAHWRKSGGSARKLVANGAGAIGTGAALAVIVVAKFAEGAWVTLLVIPATIGLFRSVRRHYVRVARELACERPIRVTGIVPPLVVVPIKGWDAIAEKAVRFATSLSPDVLAFHVRRDDESSGELRERWERLVAAPMREAGLPEPRLSVVASDFRQLMRPLFLVIGVLRRAHPDRTVAIVIPELVEAHWWQYLLHNQRATALKAALYFRGDRLVTVINVPWYLSEPSPPPS